MYRRGRGSGRGRCARPRRATLWQSPRGRNDMFGLSKQRSEGNRIRKRLRLSGNFRHSMVKLSNYLLARAVRPFPSPDGSAFIRQPGIEGDMESLGLKMIAGMLTHSNSEWCNGRFAHAGSYLGANVEELAKVMELFGDVSSYRVAAETGLCQISAALSRSKGSSVIRAAKCLNVRAGSSFRCCSELQRAIVEIFALLQSVEGPIRKLARTSAKLLAFSLSALEALAALSARDHWARQLRCQTPLHNADTVAFMHEPASDSKLMAAIVSCYMDAQTPSETWQAHRGVARPEKEPNRRVRALARGRASRQPLNSNRAGGGRICPAEDAEISDSGASGDHEISRKSSRCIDEAPRTISSLGSPLLARLRGHGGRRRDASVLCESERSGALLPSQVSAPASPSSCSTSSSLSSSSSDSASSSSSSSSA